MRSLYLRIYLTVVAALALFALVSGWLVQRHLEDQRVRAEARCASASRPGASCCSAPCRPTRQRDEQVQALRDWSQRLRVPMALDDAAGQRIAASESFVRRERAEAWPNAGLAAG